MKHMTLALSATGYRHLTAISTMRKAADGQDVNPVWKDVYIWFMNNEKWRERCMAIHSALAYTNLAGPVKPKKPGSFMEDPLFKRYKT